MLPSPLTPFPILIWTFMSSKTPGRDLKDMGSLDRTTPFPTLSSKIHGKTWRVLTGFKIFDLSGKNPVSELQSCSCYLGLAIWSHYLDLAIPVLLSWSCYLCHTILVSLSWSRYLDFVISILPSWSCYLGLTFSISLSQSCYLTHYLDLAISSLLSQSCYLDFLNLATSISLLQSCYLNLAISISVS